MRSVLLPSTAPRLAVATVVLAALLTCASIVGGTAGATPGTFGDEIAKLISCSRFEDATGLRSEPASDDWGSRPGHLQCALVGGLLLQQSAQVWIDLEDGPSAYEQRRRAVSGRATGEGTLTRSEPLIQRILQSRLADPYRHGHGIEVELNRLYRGAHIRIVVQRMEASDAEAIALTEAAERTAMAIVDGIGGYEVRIELATTPLEATVHVTAADGDDPQAWQLRFFIEPAPRIAAGVHPFGHALDRLVAIATQRHAQRPPDGCLEVLPAGDRADAAFAARMLTRYDTVPGDSPLPDWFSLASDVTSWAEERRAVFEYPLHYVRARPCRVEDAPFVPYFLDMQAVYERTALGGAYGATLRAQVEAPSQHDPDAPPTVLATATAPLELDLVAAVTTIHDLSRHVSEGDHPGVWVVRHGAGPPGSASSSLKQAPFGVRGLDTILLEERARSTVGAARLVPRRDSVALDWITPCKMTIAVKQGAGDRTISIGPRAIPEVAQAGWAARAVEATGISFSAIGVGVGVLSVKKVGVAVVGAAAASVAAPVLAVSGIVVGIVSVGAGVYLWYSSDELNPFEFNVYFGSTALIDLGDVVTVYMIEGAGTLWAQHHREPLELPAAHQLVMTPDGEFGPVTPFRTEDLPDELAEVLHLLRSPDTAPPPPPDPEARPELAVLAVPGSYVGDLTAMTPGRVYLTLEQPATIVATLRSVDFDTILELYDDQGRLIDANDDYHGTDSRLVVDLAAGTYELLVASYWPDGAGTYTLEADLHRPPPAVFVEVDAPGTRSGHLSEEAVDTYLLTLSWPATVTVDLRSPDFDAYLEAYDAGGFLIGFNDDHHGTDSRLVLTLAPGTYRFETSSFSYWESGAYTITFAW